MMHHPLNPFSADPYIDQHRARSILSLPLINQGKLIGILYLENNLTPRVFTPARVTVVESSCVASSNLASENTRLYRDLADIAKGRLGVWSTPTFWGIFIWNLEGAIVGVQRSVSAHGAIRP